MDRYWRGDDSGNEGDYSVAANWSNVNIRNADYKWTASSSGTSEYYLELAAGGDPGITEPADVLEDGEAMTAGTAGSLTASQWDYGDNDTLGYSTVYVRLADGADPDSKAIGYVEFQQVPVAGDDVYIQGSQSITAGLDQSSVELNAFRVLAGYTGTIGSVTQMLRIDLGDGDAFEYAGSGRGYIDLGTAAVSPLVTNAPTLAGGLYGLVLKGSALATIDIRKGGVLIDKSSTVTTINQAYDSNRENDTQLKVPSGATLTTLNKTGGAAIVEVAATTINNDAGQLVTAGSGAVGTLEVTGGVVYPQSSGTITQLNAFGGRVDMSRSRVSRTVTDVTLAGSGVVVYDSDVVTLTNPPERRGAMQLAAA